MDLNIRNIPEDLMRELKRTAVDQGKTLREYCIDLLSLNLTPATRLLGLVKTGRDVVAPPEPKEFTIERGGDFSQE